MPYTYYQSGSATRFATPKEELTNWFDELIQEQFSIAPNVHTILEETSFGSNEYQNVSVRITTGLNVLTGEKLGDDFKMLLFSNREHDVYMGSLFYFDNNYWIVYNIEKTKNLATSAMIRRCNNVLRWVDNFGAYHSEYCAIDYPMKRPVESNSSINPVTPEAFIIIYTQLNSDTNLIKSGQRFLFGNQSNWNCIRIYGGGIRNYLNRQTTDNDSAKLLMFSAGLDYVNEDTDDLINGIADYHQFSYTFSAYPSSYEGKVGESFQIDPDLELNGLASDADISYLSSASTIASVDNNGNVELSSAGSAIISMWVTGNTSASASILVAASASATSSYEIRLSPNINVIYEGETQEYSVYAYYGGIVQPETFSFEISGSVPSTKYLFTEVDGNNFSIENLGMYLDYPINVSVSSGSLIKNVEFELKGAW